MINDKTIDYSTARFYCAFADKDLEAALDKATSYSKDDGKRFGKLIQQIETKSKSVNEVDWNFVQAAHQAAFPLATGNPFQPNFRALDPKSGVKSLEDQAKSNVIAGAAAAALAGASFIPGGWAAIGSAVTGALGTIGSTIASTALSIGAGAITAIIAGLVTVSSYLYPRISLWLKNLSRNNYLAECHFTADDIPYKCFYSLDKNKWILTYNNNRWIRSGTTVSPNDTSAFFNTKFFEKFAAKCEKNLRVIFDSEKNKNALKTLAEMSDKKSARQLQLFLNCESKIKENMFAGKYVTENSELEEDDVSCASGSSGIVSQDVLGKCDHHDGYL